MSNYCKSENIYIFVVFSWQIKRLSLQNVHLLFLRISFYLKSILSNISIVLFWLLFAGISFPSFYFLSESLVGSNQLGHFFFLNPSASLCLLTGEFNSFNVIIGKICIYFATCFLYALCLLCFSIPLLLPPLC